ncbi:MAG TPA: hypothetical protein VI942_01730, partial [Thermoanaerobaculia bacterium]|nr:hypothetical protein [Thermoanaerobaculia bacterium]
MSSIADWKSDLQAKTPVVVFRVVLKDGSPYYWSPRAITWDGDDYDALVLSHSPLLIPGEGVYGVDAVDQISLELNNADANLNAILDPTIWQGGSIQPFWLLLDPATGATSDDQITYPKFLIDLPTETFPRVKFSAHSKWNLARKMLPLSVITKRDRYPFPDTEDERDAAFNDPTSEFYANGYSPENGHGNYKTGTTPYSRAEYNGMREDSGDGAHFGASTIGLSVRFGGFGKVPATTSFTPKKGERADFPGDANEAKYAAAVPLIYGTCRYQ